MRAIILIASALSIISCVSGQKCNKPDSELI